MCNYPSWESARTIVTAGFQMLARLLNETPGLQLKRGAKLSDPSEISRVEMSHRTHSGLKDELMAETNKKKNRTHIHILMTTQNLFFFEKLHKQQVLTERANQK